MSFLSDLFSGKKSHIRATKLSDGFYRLEFKGKLHNKITAHVGVLVVVRDLASDSGFGHEWKPLVQLPYSFESPDWLPLPAVGVKFMDYPYSGSREIEFKAYFFYMSKPVLFNENTKEIINEHHAFHSLATTESITFQQPGIEDLAENREECKPLKTIVHAKLLRAGCHAHLLKILVRATLLEIWVCVIPLIYLQYPMDICSATQAGVGPAFGTCSPLPS